jgi:hypothetical protein
MWKSEWPFTVPRSELQFVSNDAPSAVSCRFENEHFMPDLSLVWSRKSSIDCFVATHDLCVEVAGAPPILARIIPCWSGGIAAIRASVSGGNDMTFVELTVVSHNPGLIGIDPAF